MFALSLLPVIPAVTLAYKLRTNEKELLAKCTVNSKCEKTGRHTTSVIQPGFRPLLQKRAILGGCLVISLLVTAIALPALAYFSGWSLIGLKGIQFLKPLAELSSTNIKIFTAVSEVLCLYFAFNSYLNFAQNRETYNTGVKTFTFA